MNFSAPSLNQFKLKCETPVKVISRILRTGGAITKNGQLVQFESSNAHNYLNPYISTWYARDRSRLVTSDHMMVTRRFEESIPRERGTSLTVSTWNMMNKGHSKKSCSSGNYSNNPEDIDELPDDYEVRTYIQIQQIMQHIADQGPAAILLQEVNFLYSRARNDSVLQQTLRSELSRRGYELITSFDREGKKQAIIYDKHQLDHKGNADYEMPGQRQDGRKALFTADFTDKNTGRTVRLSSMHLHYDNDYSQALIKHAHNSAHGQRDDVLYIAGGDTNHTPGTQIQGVMGDFTHATNYDLGSTIQDGDPNRLKCYDTFAACSSRGSVVSKQLAGQRFVTEQGRMAVEDYGVIDHLQVSLPGRPWVRPDALVLDRYGYRKVIMKSLSDHGLLCPDQMVAVGEQQTIASLLKEALICITEGQPYVQAEVFPLEKLDALIQFLRLNITDSKYQEFIGKIEEARGLLLQLADSSLQTSFAGESRGQPLVANGSRGGVYGSQSRVSPVESAMSSLDRFQEKRVEKIQSSILGRSGIFKTKVRGNESLADLLAPERMQKGTRSAQVAFELKWVDGEGNLKNTAPDDVIEAWGATRFDSSFRPR